LNTNFYAGAINIANHGDFAGYLGVVKLNTKKYFSLEL
jgi:hypothetical protein